MGEAGDLEKRPTWLVLPANALFSSVCEDLANPDPPASAGTKAKA